MPLITQLVAVLVFTCLSFTARGEKLRIVTEPWAPYVYEDNGKSPVSYTHLTLPTKA